MVLTAVRNLDGVFQHGAREARDPFPEIWGVLVRLLISARRLSTDLSGHKGRGVGTRAARNTEVAVNEGTGRFDHLCFAASNRKTLIARGSRQLGRPPQLDLVWSVGNRGRHRVGLTRSAKGNCAEFSIMTKDSRAAATGTRSEIAATS